MDKDTLAALGPFEVLAPPMVISDRSIDVLGDFMEETRSFDAAALGEIVTNIGWSGNDPRAAMTALKPPGQDSPLFPYHPAQGLYAMAWTYIDPSKPDAPFNWDNTFALILKEYDIDGGIKLLPYQLCASQADVALPFRFGCCPKAGCSMLFVIEEEDTKGVLQADSPITKDVAREFFLMHLDGGITMHPDVLRHVVAHALGQDHACSHTPNPLAPAHGIEGLKFD